MSKKTFAELMRAELVQYRNREKEVAATAFNSWEMLLPHHKGMNNLQMEILEAIRKGDGCVTVKYPNGNYDKALFLEKVQEYVCSMQDSSVAFSMMRSYDEEVMYIYWSFPEYL